MANEITPKEERFAQLVVELGCQSEAYRRAYNSKAKQQSVAVNASKLANKPNVALRIQDIRDELAEKSIWKKLDSLEVLSEIAKGQTTDTKDSDRVNAVKALNSMFGWDKVEVKHSGSIDVVEVPLSERLTGGSKR